MVSFGVPSTCYLNIRGRSNLAIFETVRLRWVANLLGGEATQSSFPSYSKLMSPRSGAGTNLLQSPHCMVCSHSTRCSVIYGNL